MTKNTRKFGQHRLQVPLEIRRQPWPFTILHTTVCIVYKYCQVGSILRSLKDEVRGSGNDDTRRERDYRMVSVEHGYRAIPLVMGQLS